MTVPLQATASAEPEQLLNGLRHRLTRHALWEAALFFLPPLLALCYIAFFLYRFAWLGAEAIIAAGATLLCVAAALAVWRFRSLLPSPRFAARLIDDRAEGKDRFVTLATIDPARSSPALLSRLRLEAAALLPRVHLKRDFPFRARRSFVNSCIGSLLAILLVHLFLALAPGFGSKTKAVEELALLSRRLSSDPRFEKLAARLKKLAAAIQEPALSKEEKRSQIEELLDSIREQLAAERLRGGSGEELLRQAADQLSGLEEGLEKGQGKGGGGGQDRSPQQRGSGGNKTGDEGQAEKHGGLSIPLPDMSALPIPGLTTPPRKELKGNEAKGEAEGGQTRGGKATEKREKGGELERGTKENTESKGSRGEWEFKPIGPTPQRFLQPGEQGQAGLKDPRFVIVQLPEEEIAGQSGGAADEARKRKGVSGKLPVGNLPLRQPDLPEGSPEKQMMPLEYRGMIR